MFKLSPRLRMSTSLSLSLTTTALCFRYPGQTPYNSYSHTRSGPSTHTTSPPPRTIHTSSRKFALTEQKLDEACQEFAVGISAGSTSWGPRLRPQQQKTSDPLSRIREYRYLVTNLYRGSSTYNSPLTPQSREPVTCSWHKFLLILLTGVSVACH